MEDSGGKGFQSFPETKTEMNLSSPQNGPTWAAFGATLWGNRAKPSATAESEAKDEAKAEAGSGDRMPSVTAHTLPVTDTPTPPPPAPPTTITLKLPRCFGSRSVERELTAGLTLGSLKTDLLSLMQPPPEAPEVPEGAPSPTVADMHLFKSGAKATNDNPNSLQQESSTLASLNVAAGDTLHLVVALRVESLGQVVVFAPTETGDEDPSVLYHVWVSNHWRSASYVLPVPVPAPATEESVLGTLPSPNWTMLRRMGGHYLRLTDPDRGELRIPGVPLEAGLFCVSVRKMNAAKTATEDTSPVRKYKFQVPVVLPLTPSAHPIEPVDQDIVKRFLAIIPKPIRDFILTMGDLGPGLLDSILVVAENVVVYNQKIEKYRPYVMMLIGFVFPEAIVAEAWFVSFVGFCKWALKIKAQGGISLSDLVKALTGKIPMTDKIRHAMVKIIGYVGGGDTIVVPIPGPASIDIHKGAS